MSRAHEPGQGAGSNEARRQSDARDIPVTGGVVVFGSGGDAVGEQVRRPTRTSDASCFSVGSRRHTGAGDA